MPSATLLVFSIANRHPLGEEDQKKSLGNSPNSRRDADNAKGL
jgi:hypothetical protein